MNIVRLFKVKNYENICSKTQQIAPFKKISRKSMLPDPPSKRLATPRVASRFAACNSPSPSKSCPRPLGKSCIRPWTTTKKFI